jgi:NADP-dependent 3-hydroxy acid dehydrogenase YdfG
MDVQLTNRLALVTGSTAGIGLAIAPAAFCGARSYENLEECNYRIFLSSRLS